MMISNRQPPVAVEYDGPRGERRTKQFDNPYEARRFYAKQLNAGKNPTIKKVS